MEDKPVIYGVGELPTSPIIHEGDGNVYVISNIEEVEEPVRSEGSGVSLAATKSWKAIVEEVLPASEYLKRLEAKRVEYEAQTDEAIIEMDMLVCENADRLDALEAAAGGEE